MNNDQINLVQTSFAKVVPISETAAELFYGRLFEIAPEVRPLFKGDMKDQGKKLMATLNVAVQSLTDLPKLVPVLEKLAIGHVPYGVKAEHYDKVGAALLWTLEQGLGESWTPETAEAWTETYKIVASTMINAAYTGEPV
ncbi:globin family protein [Ponticaulis sp.]|jgi:nitric oxide dioxygenase|uniref:globin family protein n=1 Tax=Ponticaulis sp. TaxID=2020902 RepID=UPI000C5A02F4|nr:globin family protein [Ponticaulis sp.]MBN05201.1 hemin receptor [Ponticaulis sp.]